MQLSENMQKSILLYSTKNIPLPYSELVDMFPCTVIIRK
jgi:hypothetical protein